MMQLVQLGPIADQSEAQGLVLSALRGANVNESGDFTGAGG
jgi:hypothetical protein